MRYILPFDEMRGRQEAGSRKQEAGRRQAGENPFWLYPAFDWVVSCL
jgi:hypothetical protein